MSLDIAFSFCSTTLLYFNIVMHQNYLIFGRKGWMNDYYRRTNLSVLKTKKTSKKINQLAVWVLNNLLINYLSQLFSFSLYLNDFFQTEKSKQV